MSEIKCSEHSKCKAFYVCESYGFLCDKHIDEQNIKGHVLSPITKTINELYVDFEALEKADANGLLITKLKKSFGELLDKAENQCISVEKNVVIKLKR